ncbi:MAG TPA: elongation factor G [Steroidobacteraceae bacterium]|nr:elongation factor G [Steroidobacteraceae bacterium]
MPYSTADIRNIALVGQAGAGKTLLAEALLAQTGAIRAKGSLARGTTVCDFDPQEKALLHSLDAAICGFETQGKRVNIIDAPGYPDFLGRALSALEAVETAVIVVSAVNGVDPMMQRMMEFAKNRGLCRLIVINKIDNKDARAEEVLGEIRETFGNACLPLNLPSEGGRSVVDCFFQPHGKPSDFSSVEAAHTQIIDQVVEVDEDLMALYLEQGEELSPEQLHDPFEKALREDHLVPICFCSAETGAGIPELVEVLLRLMPNPTEGNPPPFLKGEGEAATRVEMSTDPAKHVVAHVFKVTIDPFVGKLGIFRVHQGTVRTGAQLLVGDARKPIKLAHIYQLQGKDHIEVTQAIPGDICAVPKIDEIHFDAVLHDSHDEDHHHLKSVNFPPPMLGLAIRAEKRGDEQKLSEALHRLTSEDPCVRVEHHAAQNETVLYGLGDLHLRVMLQRITERYGVPVKTSPPSVPYRETITRPAEGHHRHKKQTGGAGQFGEVYLRVEPRERGAGFEFVDDVVGGAIPGQFIPAVEKGVRQVLTEGAIAGFTLQDLRVSVYDGKHHAVDSKEVAFVSAGRKAFIAAIKEAAPIILEPIVRVLINTPSGAIGDVTSDLSTRRARISGQDSLPGGRAEISALVPLAELQDYLSRLKALTGGEGTYTMDLSHYDPVPARKQQELVAAYKPHEEAE